MFYEYAHTLWDFFSFSSFIKKLNIKLLIVALRTLLSEVSQFDMYAKYIKEIGLPLELVGNTFSDFI